MTKRISAVVLALLMCLLTLAFSVTSFSSAKLLLVSNNIQKNINTLFKIVPPTSNLS